MIKIIGADKVRKEFQSIGKMTYGDFMDLISRQILYLLYHNTPVDTGELRDSWQEIERTDTYIGIGTRDDQLDKLNALIFGTRYMQPIDFLTPIVELMQENIDGAMRGYLKKKHRYFKDISAGHQDIDTPSNIVGLTGFTFSKRRSRGKSYIKRTTLNRPMLRPRIYRRRKV